MSSTLTPAGSPAARTFGESQLRTDGDLLLVAFAADGSLWSLEATGLIRHWSKTGQAIDSRAVSDLETEWAFTKDARFALAGSKELSLWDVFAGRALATVPQPSWITALAPNLDPAFAATGHDDGSIRYWNIKTRTAVHTFEKHSMPISALAFHANGQLLAAASEDRKITLWNVATGEALETLVGHSDRIPALAWHPTEHVLVSAGWDRTARIWDAVKGTPIFLLNSHATQVTALAFSPDGRWLASADSGQQIHIWDYAAKKELHVLRGPAVEVRSLAFAPDSTTLAATGDRVVHLWNVVTGKPLVATDHRSKVKPSVSISADGRSLAANADGIACKVWDIATGEVLHNFTDIGQIHQVAFSPNGSLIAAACGTHIRIWNAATGELHHDLDGPEDPLAILAFSPDGTTLAGGGYTGLAVWLWSVATGEPLLIIPDPLAGCAPQALAFHPNGKFLAAVGVDWLATGGSSGAVSLWDLKGRSEVNTLPDGSTCLAFHPQGLRLAASTLDRSIDLYDVATLDLQTELLGHDGAVLCLAYSPDGSLLASGSDDQTIRFWNEAGDEVGLIEVDSKVTSIAFAPDGQSIVTAHANTTCALFPVPV